MASTMRPILRLGVSSAGINGAVRRSFMTSSFARAARPTSQNLLPKSKLRDSFRRGYAEQKVGALAAELAPTKKPRRFRALRWIWRVTYLSLLGGVGYMAYTVYDLRHPVDQFEPDPSKQNLVILGEYTEPYNFRSAAN
jgi:NADH:ubiquinone reductase (non-electrogenic)